MRMWMVAPKSMCNQHLLGEHVEIHMLVGSLQRGKSIAGFLAKGLLAPQSIQERHAALSREMINRGMQHRSPLTETVGPNGVVDPEASRQELARRCPACRARIKENTDV